MMPKTPTVAVIAVQAPGSKVWHLQEHFSTQRFITLCGKPFDDWTATFHLQDGDRLCKHCLRKLDDALGARYQIMDVGAKD